MRTKILFVVTVVLLSISQALYAQSAQEMEVLKERAKEKVAMMNRYIAYMADPRNSENTRFGYKEEAQKLFIHDCNEYTEIVEYKNGMRDTTIRHEGVTMQVASLSNKIPRTKPMKTYFRGLIKMNYKTVNMKTTDIADMRVSKLQPYGKDEDGRMLYACTVYFDQVFVGVTREGKKYQDITHKWAVCYVQVDEVLDETTGDTYKEYMVSLGDVHVDSIEKLW